LLSYVADKGAVTKRLKNEAGYSLVEVMVAIMLSIAIIPMVSMFDAAGGRLGRHYDQARTLANEKLEEVKAPLLGVLPVIPRTVPSTATRLLRRFARHPAR